MSPCTEKSAETGDRSHPGHRIRPRDRLPGNDPDLRRTPAAHRHGGGILHAPGNPFLATLGSRIDPGPRGLGYSVPAEDRARIRSPICTKLESFAATMKQHVTETLRQGRYGWQVTDCTVSLIGPSTALPTARRRPAAAPAACATSRKLTPLVVMAALKQAGAGGPAGPPVPPRHPGRHAQRPAAGAGKAARRPRGIGDQRVLVHPGGRHPGDQSARAAPADPAPHQGRRRDGIIVRPLRAGPRAVPGPPAHRRQPPQPRGIPAPHHAARLGQRRPAGRPFGARASAGSRHGARATRAAARDCRTAGTPQPRTSGAVSSEVISRR